MGRTELDVELLDHQADFVGDTDSRYVVLTGGLGCGKTVALVSKMLALAEQNAPCAGLVVEPTYDLINTILMPTVDEMFTLWERRYRYQEQKKILHIHTANGWSRVYFRSGDAPERIVGFKVGWFLLDEADLLKREVWRRAVGRWRDKRARVRQAGAVYTPEEGFTWAYERFEEKPRPGLNLIHGVSSTSNVFTHDEYVAGLEEDYDGDELARVKEGKRTKRSGLVYRAFERQPHCRPCADPFRGQPVVLCDFNVGKMHWLFGRFLAGRLHVWGELVRYGTDTYEQTRAAIDYIKARAAEHGEQLVNIASIFTVHGDASAKNPHSQSVGRGDYAIMREEGFRNVVIPASNPRVRDRVLSVNAAFRKGWILIDGDKCPELVKCLAQQGYDKNGEPEKAKEAEKGLDHGPDALGYGVWMQPGWRVTAARGNEPKIHHFH